MKPSYIDLIESGERLYLNQAEEIYPNEFTWVTPDIWFVFKPEHPNDSVCFDPVYNADGWPDMAKTILFRAYDEAGNLICEDTDHVTSFWL